MCSSDLTLTHPFTQLVILFHIVHSPFLSFDLSLSLSLSLPLSLSLSLSLSFPLSLFTSLSLSLYLSLSPFLCSHRGDHLFSLFPQRPRVVHCQTAAPPCGTLSDCSAPVWYTIRLQVHRYRPQTALQQQDVIKHSGLFCQHTEYIHYVGYSNTNIFVCVGLVCEKKNVFHENSNVAGSMDYNYNIVL